MKAVLLVEQERIRQERIKKVILQALGKTELYLTENVEQACRILLERTIDIFVIHDGISAKNICSNEGLELILHIRQIPRYTFAPVILISELEDKGQYAYEELNCIGFLSEYFTDEYMIRLLKKASFYETKRNTNENLLFHKEGVLYPVKISEIVYIDQNDRKVYIHLANAEVMKMPYISFADILYEADNRNLIMCNRSTLVNKDYIYAIDTVNRYLVLKGGHGMIDIGNTYRKKILLEFSSEKSK